jgi:RNA polymerase sigma-70 factor (ECF subfamily)
LEEAELIQAARKGNEYACDRLMQDHHEVVFRLAYLMLGDTDDAADVAQETFIRAFNSLARFDASRPLRPWLCRIAANLARNRRRSAGRYWYNLRRFARLLPDEPPTLESETEAQLQARRLWQAVRTLSADHQHIIYLRYFLEFSVQDTADALDIASGTVKSRLHRALNQLRAVIETDFPELQEAVGIYHD